MKPRAICPYCLKVFVKKNKAHTFCCEEHFYLFHGIEQKDTDIVIRNGVIVSETENEPNAQPEKHGTDPNLHPCRGWTVDGVHHPCALNSMTTQSRCSDCWSKMRSFLGLNIRDIQQGELVN